MTTPSTGLAVRLTARALAAPLLVVLAVASAAAQGPPAAPARADTASLGFTAVAGAPAPVAVHVLSDTVTFGGILDVAWDLPAGAAADRVTLPKPADDRLAVVAPSRRRWWRRGGADREAEAGPAKAALAALAPATGERVMARYRVYRADPFRLEWAGRATTVVHVRGRVEDPSRLAAIRDPRALPWLTPAFLLLLAACLLAAAAGWWWWRRRRRSAQPGDWPLPEPAWLSATLALRELLSERRLERGEAREFLDGLASVARRFAGAHYGVPAPDLTGAELRSACAARGHEPGRPGELARLIEEADLRRYDPQSPGAGWCRQQAGRLLACIGDGRIEPRFTAVPAERILAASQAWADLTRELASLEAGQPATGGER